MSEIIDGPDLAATREIDYNEYDAESRMQAVDFALRAFMGRANLEPDVVVPEDQWSDMDQIRKDVDAAYQGLPQYADTIPNPYQEGFRIIRINGLLLDMPAFLQDVRANDETTGDEYWVEDMQVFKEDYTGVKLLQKRFLTRLEREAYATRLHYAEGQVDQPRSALQLRGEGGADTFAKLSQYMRTVLDKAEAMKQPDAPVHADTTMTRRERFLYDGWHKLHEQTGAMLTYDKNGDLKPTAQLELEGARVATDLYQKAVDTYLDKWGEKKEAPTSTSVRHEPSSQPQGWRRFMGGVFRRSK